MNLFNTYPQDMDDADVEKFDKDARYLESQLECIDEQECWLPIEGADEMHKFYFGYRSLQQAAMIMNGPMQDETRRYMKIITLCPHENCCNPDHLLCVAKRNQLRDSLVELFGDDELKWEELRASVRRYQKVKEIKIAECVQKMATPGLAPNALKAAMKLCKILETQRDWAFNKAVFDILGGDLGSNTQERFFAYLTCQGLLTAFGELPEKWQDIIKQMLDLPHSGSEVHYYENILVFVAQQTHKTRLTQQLQNMGLEVSSHEDCGV